MTSPTSTSKHHKQASRALSVFFCGSAQGIMKEVLKEIYRLHGQEEHFPTQDQDINNLQSAQSYWFANGEVKVQVSAKGLLSSSSFHAGSDLYIVQLFDDPLTRPPYDESRRTIRTLNDNLMEVLLAADAAHRAGVERITLVLPHYPYARQERKAEGECISARVVANFIESVQVDRVLTIDVHSEAIGGFFNRTRFENIQSTEAWAEHLKTAHYLTPTCNPTDYTIMAPDIGASKKAIALAAKLTSETDPTSFPYAFIHKTRIQAAHATPVPEGTLAILESDGKSLTTPVLEGSRRTTYHTTTTTWVSGDVENKHILLIDDMIGTGGTLLSACNTLKGRGAKNIYILCTFPFFNGKAVSTLHEAHAKGIFTKVIGTDMVFHGKEFTQSHAWYYEHSLAPLLAEHIYRVHSSNSIS